MSGSFRPERAERPTFLPEAAAFLPDLRHPRRFCPAGLGDKDGRPAPPPMIRTGRRAGSRQMLEPKFLRRSEEHTSEPRSLMPTSDAVFRSKKKKDTIRDTETATTAYLQPG